MTKKFSLEQKEIAGCILKGMTREEIAQKLCYSRSAISYRINLLFKQYGANTKQEFILLFMARLIEARNDKIKTLCTRLDELKLENRKIKFLLTKIILEAENKNSLCHLINKAKSEININ